MDLRDRICNKITEKESKNQLRNLEKKSGFVLDFSSNDYLCLSKNKDVISSCINFADKYGTCGMSSRVLSSIDGYFELENLIARCKNKDSALLFSSGFMANHACIKAILSLYDHDEIDVFSDRLNHASIHSGIGDFSQIRYNNVCMNHLEQRLKNSKKKHKIVITEGVFSMDGTICPIDDLIALKRKYGFMIYIDEAHSFGIFGENGYGISSKYTGEIEFSMGTLSKAVASQGGFVASCAKNITYLLNFCQGFVYSTALNPPSIGASLAAINMFSKIQEERQILLENASYLRSFFKTSQTCNSNSQIVPILMKDEENAIKCQKTLMENGIYACAIRPPTSASCRIRISLNASHTKENIDKLVEILQIYA